jgi:hypothetical protein
MICGRSSAAMSANRNVGRQVQIVRALLGIGGKIPALVTSGPAILQPCTSPRSLRLRNQEHRIGAEPPALMRPADEKNDAPVDRPIQLLGALINHLSVRVPSPTVKRTAQVHGKARELNNNNQLDRLASLVTLQPTPAVDAAGRGGGICSFSIITLGCGAA